MKRTQFGFKTVIGPVARDGEVSRFRPEGEAFPELFPLSLDRTGSIAIGNHGRR